MDHDFTVRFVQPTEQECKEVYAFLTPMAFETARMVADPVTCLQEIYRVAKDELLFVVQDETGRIVASAGIIKARMWYAKDGECLSERWFYITPELRNHPKVFPMMMSEVQALSDATGLLAVIGVFNRKRFDRQRRTGWGPMMELWSIMPAGARIVYVPRDDDGRIEREDDNRE